MRDPPLVVLDGCPRTIDRLGRCRADRLQIGGEEELFEVGVGHIATKLGLETIVEGIEREEQRMALLDLGFCRAQGYLFARPLALAEALDPNRSLIPADARR